jgi:6,7-dimethyl-8-ribityllumazine synthase
METLGKEHAAFLGATVDKIYYVPGVFDMPLAVKKMASDKTIDAVVTLGCVIQGATKHDEIVIQHATRKIADLALEFSKPITLGISGPGMSMLKGQLKLL